MIIVVWPTSIYIKKKILITPWPNLPYYLVAIKVEMNECRESDEMGVRSWQVLIGANEMNEREGICKFI